MWIKYGLNNFSYLFLEKFNSHGCIMQDPDRPLLLGNLEVLLPFLVLVDEISVVSWLCFCAYDLLSL